MAGRDLRFQNISATERKEKKHALSRQPARRGISNKRTTKSRADLRGGGGGGGGPRVFDCGRHGTSERTRIRMRGREKKRSTDPRLPGETVGHRRCSAPAAAAAAADADAYFAREKARGGWRGERSP
uniref:Uncharacterized protein n=1 Tax=Oryza brachyantha TaxID=4533 RepID=J3LBE7_ORYBR